MKRHFSLSELKSLSPALATVWLVHLSSHFVVLCLLHRGSLLLTASSHTSILAVRVLGSIQQNVNLLNTAYSFVTYGFRYLGQKLGSGQLKRSYCLRVILKQVRAVHYNIVTNLKSHLNFFLGLVQECARQFLYDIPFWQPDIVGTVGQGRVCIKLHFKRIKEKPPFGHHSDNVAKGNKDLTL